MNPQIQVVFYSVALLSALGLILFSYSVLGAKPNFSATPSVTKNSDLSITTNFRAEDLGKRTANVTLNAQYTALIGCINPGGNLSPSKGMNLEQMLSNSIKIKPNDGKIKGSLTLNPPVVPSGSEICPNKNWSTSILSLTYENVALDIKQRNSEVLGFDFGNLSK